MDINTLYTLAAKEPKIKKPDAQDIIKKMFEETDDSYTQRQLAQLYSFFMPAPPAKAKNAFQWVAKAVSKDSLRPYLHYVYCDGEYIIATDGHRLHFAPAEGREVGFYDLQDNIIADYGHVFPPNWELAVLDINNDDTKKVFSGKVSELPVKTISDKKEGILYSPELADNDIRQDYLKQALNGADTLELYACGNKFAVQSEFGFATIMGVNRNKR